METVRIGSLDFGGGIPRIIVPLVSSTVESLRREAQKIRSLPVDMAEWRVDMFGAPGPVDVKAVQNALHMLRGELSVPLLATFRTIDEGGKRPFCAECYAQLCAMLCESGLIDMLDVEAFFRTGESKGIIARAHACGVPVLASNHEFHATPAREEIVRRLLFMQEDLGADIAKIAVMPQNPADVITLLSATQKAFALAKRPIITISMGSLGVISRVSGSFFGSSATFGAAEYSSAPGQMEVSALHAVLKALELSSR